MPCMPLMKMPVLLKTLPVTIVNRFEIRPPLLPSTGSFPSFERPNPCVALGKKLSFPRSNAMPLNPLAFKSQESVNLID